MKHRSEVLAMAILAGLCLGGPAVAQPVPMSMPTMPNTPSATDTSRDLQRAQDMVSKRKTEQQLTPEQIKAMDMTDATALAATAKLPCTVTDAQLLLEGEEVIDGKKVKTQTYEIACDSGLGYFLVKRGETAPPVGYTCVAAAAAYEADVKAKRAPAPACTLPANADLKAMAAGIVQRKGQTCAIKAVAWVGQSSKSNTDFSEIACEDGNGFIMASPVPGSQRPIAILKCHDAAMQGLPCKMSDNGTVLTVQTFKDELAKHNVTCDATDVRVIGKESTKKRHVVEFACSQHPEGLVAFIPLEDTKEPFETLSCAEAAKRKVMCALPHK